MKLHEIAFAHHIFQRQINDEFFILQKSELIKLNQFYFQILIKNIKKYRFQMINFSGSLGPSFPLCCCCSQKNEKLAQNKDSLNQHNLSTFLLIQNSIAKNLRSILILISLNVQD
ncbi:hypothetical protein ABPG72_015339 [Tetrahymena utriculariae]